MVYCLVADLLTGDMPVTLSRAEQFIQAAADEMEMRLGQVYTLPFPALGTQATLVLKRLNVLIATGRLIMAQAVGSEDESTNAYGTYLLHEGQGLLDAILSGDITLEDVPKTEVHTIGNGPSIIFEDSQFGVDAFYGFAMRGEHNSWTPGL